MTEKNRDQLLRGMQLATGVMFVSADSTHEGIVLFITLLLMGIVLIIASQFPLPPTK